MYGVGLGLIGSLFPLSLVWFLFEVVWVFLEICHKFIKQKSLSTLTLGNGTRASNSSKQ